jgi:hypothetical protein
MSALSKAVAVALLHVLIVMSLGGKLLYDRAHRPRVWVRTGSVDPDLPIRGRYFTLRVQVRAPWFEPSNYYHQEQVRLSVENGELVASKSDSPTGLTITIWRTPNRLQQNRAVLLDQSVPFFIPEHAAFPLTKAGEELWAEVTVPRKGPPRPLQLAVKKGTDWLPLNLR